MATELSRSERASEGRVTARAKAPRDLPELLERANALAGHTLAEIAHVLGFFPEGHGTKTKGKVGELLERALGAKGSCLSEPDFLDLGVELKTVPVNTHGRTAESTYVCMLPLASADRATFADSPAWRKLECVLWIPVNILPQTSLLERTIGRPVLWRPTSEQKAVLEADFNEIVGFVGAGHIDALTAKVGRFLQARPKAAHGRVLRQAFGPEGELTSALPRGFYLRSRFTTAILRDPSAMPRC